MAIERFLGLHDGEDEAGSVEPLTPAPMPGRDGLIPFASGAPVMEGMKALRKARNGWPSTDSQGNPTFVFQKNRPWDVRGQFNIIVPRDDYAFRAAEAELAQKILHSFGHRTVRLHLACAAYTADPSTEAGKYITVPGKRIRDLLGLSRPQRSDLTRRERDALCREEVERLASVGVQLTILSNIQDDGWADFERLRRLQPVWDLQVHEHGQMHVTADGSTRGEEWQLLIRPTAWAQLYVYNDEGRQFGYFSKALLKNIDWRHPEAGDLALALLRFCRYQSGRPKDLTVRAMLNICNLEAPSGKRERNRNRHKLENAILQQQAWGWKMRWTRWPEEYRPACEDRSRMPKGYWETWQDWKVEFIPPEDLSRANNVRGVASTTRPKLKRKKGWAPERVRSLVQHTQDQMNWTQSAVADELGVSSSYLSKWKSGARSPGKKHRKRLKSFARFVGFEN